jgi:hypothetical protein
MNTTMTLLQQITQTSVLIPYEQFFYPFTLLPKELIRKQNTGENNPMIFDPHIRSPPAIHNDQYFDTTTS